MSLISWDSTKYFIYAIFGLIGLCTIFGLAFIFNQEQYSITENLYPTDILFIVLPAAAIIFGIYLSIKNRFKGNHGKAWFFFTLALSSWLIAELTYSYNSEIDIEDFSTLISDIFYMLGYPLFLTFTFFYLKPRRQIISKNLIVVASLASMVFVIPSIYFTIGIEDELSPIETVLYGLYPILDGIILVPSIIAVVLFFRGQVNLLWIMLLLGTFTMFIADSVYLILEINHSYQLGNFVDVLFLWSYVFYALGVWSYIQIYKNSTKSHDMMNC